MPHPDAPDPPPPLRRRRRTGHATGDSPTPLTQYDRAMTTKPYDVNVIRARFPSLANTLPDGRQLSFLDGPAGTQVPQAVIDAYRDFFLHANANSGGAFIKWD